MLLKVRTIEQNGLSTLQITEVGEKTSFEIEVENVLLGVTMNKFPPAEVEYQLGAKSESNQNLQKVSLIKQN